MHYDTIPTKETKYDYVMDPDVYKFYSYKDIMYTTPVFYLTDTILKNRNGRTITDEEHKRFINEHQ